MRDFTDLMDRYEAWKDLYQGSHSDLLERDKQLHRKRHLLENAIKDVDLKIIRNAHEISALLWPVFLKENKDEHVTELESKS